jgi:hypothetical protein
MAFWFFSSEKDSIHRSGGWRGHYARVLRWHVRLTAFCETAYLHDTLADTDFDDMLAFFVTCYHLADWLESDGAVPNKVADHYVRETLPLMVCRDICNGSKHAALTRQRSLREFAFHRQYRAPFVVAFAWEEPGYENPLAAPGYEHVRTEMFGVQQLADDCLTAWRAFFSAHSLEPTR